MMKAFITECRGVYYVTIQEYKHNTLRGDDYWVTRQVKAFRRQSDALKFRDRFID